MQSFYSLAVCFRRRCRLYILSIVFGVIAGTVAPARAIAQDSQSQSSGDSMMGLWQGLQLMLHDLHDARGTMANVHILPAVVAVDPKTHVATVHLENVGERPVVVTIRVTDGPGEPSDTLHADSVWSHWSLRSWITDLPSKMSLAPHTKRDLTLHLAVPPHITRGEYTSVLHLEVTTQNNSMLVLESATSSKLVYRVR